MNLFWKLLLLEFASTILIVVCTRAYVDASYKWSLVIEVLFISQWFYNQRLVFDDPRTRAWNYGFLAYQIGALSGVACGIWGSQHLLGK